MRRLYGGTPMHMVGHVLLLVLTGYAVVQIFAPDGTGGSLLWLAGAVVLHDAVLWPLYSAPNTLGEGRLGVAANYVRVPLGLSLMLALVFLATISGKGESTYTHASGRGWDGHLARWLVVSGALFVLSGALYLLRRRRSDASS